MTNEKLCQDVIDAMVSEGELLSATGISRLLGYSKKNNNVSLAIAELLEMDAIGSEQKSGNFYYYVKDASAVEKEVTYKVVEFDDIDVEVPSDTFGYTIEELSKEFKVTFPSGKTWNFAKSRRLLVINKEKHIELQKPEDIISAIHYYCELVQIRDYIIRDLNLGQAVNTKDINTKPAVIFLSIQRHNKAGF